ncbi:hypothetical protein Ccrd_016585 [Cynara cardunculus var. scolymus]|uniref:Bile acid:sodium symporter n=1 Tax=Cynara cardunculus var. scolymus TaxID=59895 RepID=A0A103Y9M1_CYNCS|nr:hypothetical protein Ccrd_016585 [Cynara cardunculus var. scolymus]
MARMLHTLTVTPPVTRTAHFRSRNCEFTSPHLVSCNRIFGGIITNSLLPRKLHSVNGRKIIRNSAISDQGNGGLDRDPQAATVANFLVSTKALLNFAANNALSVALIGAIVLGMANPTPGCIAHRYNVSTFSVFGMFIISGLTLGNEEIGEAAEAWPIALFGLASILLLTPLLSRIMVQLPLQPQEFATGLALYNCMPTAISSGVALTRIAGGNAALALMMTVTSSLLGVLIVPFSISKLVGGGVGASVPAGSLLSVNPLKIPWTQVSTSRPLLLSVKPTLVLVAVKSITVLVAVVNQLGATFGASGLLVLPCIAAHLSQV